MRVDLGMLTLAIDKELAAAEDPTADGQTLKIVVEDYPDYVNRKRGIESVAPPTAKTITLVSEKYWIGDKLLYRWSIDIGECV